MAMERAKPLPESPPALCARGVLQNSVLLVEIGLWLWQPHAGTAQMHCASWKSPERASSVPLRTTEDFL